MKHASSQRYELQHDRCVPSSYHAMPIMGVTLVHISAATVAPPSIRLDGITAPVPYTDRDAYSGRKWYQQMESWRMYILYADGRLSCYTLKRS